MKEKKENVYNKNKKRKVFFKSIKSEFICVLTQDLGFGGWDFVNNKKLCVSFFIGGSRGRALCILC
jgi:hypothetical protein